MDEIINWKHFSDEQRTQIMDRLAKLESTHVCPSCGEPAHCDISNGKKSCWCFELDRRDTTDLPHTGVCVCRTCMSKLPLR